uniref:Uncharacterized protein n=1 Tax=Pithovirus LCPAC104 TaxID=2506589 RepID=A0A481Z7J2_9VIRU|nr:MAG: hypothetical protein LCPAC104_01580 [Pithovirus LCPAC104]
MTTLSVPIEELLEIQKYISITIPDEKSIEEILIKGNNETLDFYDYRSEYSIIAKSLYPELKNSIAIVLGYIIANLKFYKVKYPEDLYTAVLKIDKYIRSLEDI